MKSTIFLIIFPIILVSFVVHEYAHGWVAYKFGDPTAKNSGRLTLNPLAHMDMITTVLLPLACLAMGWPALAIAKPVPINGHYLKNPRKDMIWIAAAGPASNMVMAVLAALILRFWGGWIAPFSSMIIGLFILVNLSLAIFNLIPIPPLDGSRILAGLLPFKQAMVLHKIERYGFVIIFCLVFFTDVLSWILWPTLTWCWRFLGLPYDLLYFIVTGEPITT